MVIQNSGLVELSKMWYRSDQASRSRSRSPDSLYVWPRRVVAFVASARASQLHPQRFFANQSYRRTRIEKLAVLGVPCPLTVNPRPTSHCGVSLHLSSTSLRASQSLRILISIRIKVSILALTVPRADLRLVGCIGTLRQCVCECECVFKNIS